MILPEYPLSTKQSFGSVFIMCAGVGAVGADLKAIGFKTKAVEGRLPNEHRDRLTVKLKIMTMKPVILSEIIGLIAKNSSFVIIDSA